MFYINLIPLTILIISLFFCLGISVLILFGDNSVYIEKESIKVIKSNLLFNKTELIDKTELKSISFIPNLFETTNLLQIQNNMHKWEILNNILSFLLFPFIKIIQFTMPNFIQIIKIEDKNGIKNSFLCCGIQEDHYTNSDKNTFENLIKFIHKYEYPIIMTNKIRDIIFILNESPKT